MNQAIAMRIMMRNKIFITNLHAGQKLYKQLKREADEDGSQEDEYFYHNTLKRIKEDIRKLTQEQKELKRIVQRK